MSAPHFFVDPPLEQQALLSPEDTRHALRSLRLRPGDEVTLGDDMGAVARGRVRGEQSGRAIIEVLSVTREEPGVPRLSVLLSPPKGERLAWATQKLGELGASELALLETERSVRKLDRTRMRQRLARLQAIAREAAMQSRQAFVMKVRAGGEVRTETARGDSPLVMLWEEADCRLADALPELPGHVRLLVGPEGGFSREEVAAARSAGGTTASLGRAILRSETAAVVAAALTLARYGRLG